MDRLLEQHERSGTLAAALRAVLNRAAAPTRETLIKQSVEALIRLFESCSSTTEADARTMHEEWRYRGMKALYLFRLLGGFPDRSDLAESLNEQLAALALPDAEAGSFEDSFQFDGAETFMVAHRGVIEVRYRYSAPIWYIDPEDEDAKVVADLRNGFVWLCPSGGWAAIAARDLDTRDRVEACVRGIVPRGLIPLRFNKDIVARLEQRQRRRRVALINPQTRTTRRYTGPRLGQDNDAQREIQGRWNQDDAPFTSYSIQVDGGTEMVLGYNNGQGKIFFSKDLTAEQLRAWGPTKIMDVLEAVADALRTRPPYKREVIDAHLRTLPKGARNAAAELVEAVAACKAGEVSEHELQRPVLELRNELKGLVSSSLYPVREDTEELAELECAACHSDRVNLNADGSAIECRSCGAAQDHRRLSVSEGSPLRVGAISRIVQLLPQPELLEPVLEAASAITGRPSNPEEEFFHIVGDTLRYRRVTGNVVLNVADIPEFAALLDPNPSGTRRTNVLASLPLFKEKCSRMNTANCARCVGDRVGRMCFLRLFGLFDGSFTPQPHGGIEYGDYARTVTVGGEPDQYCVVLMKKAPRGDGAITSSSKSGREILEQAIKYLQDAGTAVIGVSVPHLLHDNLKKLLIQAARWHEKKLIFFDAPTLARVVSTVMTRRSMRLDGF